MRTVLSLSTVASSWKLQTRCKSSGGGRGAAADVAAAHVFRVGDGVEVEDLVGHAAR
ncbi:MAG: hypothetical protein ABI629_08130 [bacterium]